MKGLFVVCGLLLTACLAQDWFYELKQDTVASAVDDSIVSKSRSYSSSVVVDGHVYTLVDLKAADISASYTGNSVGSTNVVSALFDLTTKKYVIIGVSSGLDITYSYFPESLCTDGTYLYASVYKTNTGATYSLNDEFSGFASSIDAYSALYKFDKNLNVLDRITSMDVRYSFLSCSSTNDGSSVFLLRVDENSGTATTLYDKNGENSFDFGTCGSNPGCILGVKELFDSSKRQKLFSYDEQLASRNGKITGSIVGTGADNAVVVSFFTGNKFIMALQGSSGPAIQGSFTHENGNNDGFDYPTIVAMNSTYFITVFTTKVDVCNDGGGAFTRLVFVPLKTNGGAVSRLSPVCMNLADASDNMKYEIRRTLAVPHPEDGKLFVMAPFRSYKFAFCGTFIYSPLSGQNEASAMLATIDADSLTCISAQPIDPIIDQCTKTMVALPEDKIAITEFYKASSSSWTAWTRTFKYVRCEDGVIDKDKKECICFGDGIKCSSRYPDVPSSSVTPSSLPGSSTPSSPTGSSDPSDPSNPSSPSSPSSPSNPSNPSVSSTPGSSQVSSLPISKHSDSKSPDSGGNAAVSIALIALTGAFLILAIVFIILFAVCK